MVMHENAGATEWSISEIARLTGTTSRTLRHYGDIGLLEPSRVAANGYRWYDGPALARLQRILLLRELGLALPAIGEVLDGQRDHAEALRAHLRWLAAEKDRIDRQIGSVQKTITTMERGETLMAEHMFDGFDHTSYREEVEERWGAKAYATSDAWWRAKTAAEKAQWQADKSALAADWLAEASTGSDPAGEAAQALAQRQYDWLGAIPGTPGFDSGGPTKQYFVGLAEMYVADPRFAEGYGGEAGATFVRDAMIAYAARMGTRR